MVLEIDRSAERLVLESHALGALQPRHHHPLGEDAAHQSQRRVLEIHQVHLTTDRTLELDADVKAATEALLSCQPGLEVHGDVHVTVDTGHTARHRPENVRERDRLIGEHCADPLGEILEYVHVATTVASRQPLGRPTATVWTSDADVALVADPVSGSTNGPSWFAPASIY